MAPSEGNRMMPQQSGEGNSPKPCRNRFLKQVSWQWRLNLFLLILLTFFSGKAFSQKMEFNYYDCLFGETGTLCVSVARIDRESGVIECNGGDTAQPAKPFSWDWGDGFRSRGFFPQTHQYRDRQRNYLVRVTSHYQNGGTDSAETIVCFHPFSPPSRRIALPGDVRVSIPRKKPGLQPVRAPYIPSPSLTVFDDSFFQICSRESAEYLLTITAAIQLDLANNNVCKTNGRFEQALLRDPASGGMYSIWYTEPIGLGAGDYAFKGDLQWSSLFHEMGHNVTLNSPAGYHWGFRQDGPANTIYSETMAQIFQHATAYELLNDSEKYGIGGDWAFDIARSARASMQIVRRSYANYRKNGCHFCSWNDKNTKNDETFDTFMTIAFKFFEHAERNRKGYRTPVKRIMEFMQRFNPEWEAGFSARKNNPRAEQFRATLSVAALSYAFNQDLRKEFLELRFPVDDDLFLKLLTAPEPSTR